MYRYGGKASGALPTDLKRHARALRTARLVMGDFERVLCLVREGDFVYLDPPYSVNAWRVFNEYNAASFNEDSLVRLRIWLEKLTEKRVEFVVSYALSDEAKFLGHGFKRRVIQARRNIAGFSDKRVPAKEVLISNF